MWLVLIPWKNICSKHPHPEDIQIAIHSFKKNCKKKIGGKKGLIASEAFKRWENKAMINPHFAKKSPLLILQDSEIQIIWN